MFKLIKLEWKKHFLGKCARSAAIMSAVLMVFLFLMATSGELESEEALQTYGKSMINAAVEVFVHGSFIIFTAVMLSSFIVGTYQNKTMNLMFSYPISRRKILAAKLLAVWIFNFTAMVVCKVLIYIALILTKSYTQISVADIRMGDVGFWLNLLISSALMVSISFAALPVGMMKKSTKATIVASVVIACVTQGNIGSATLVNNIPFYLLMLAVSAFAIFLSLYNVERMDVI